MKIRIIRWVISAAAIVTAGALVCAVPSGEWLSIGKQAAVLAIGLSQPKDSTQLIRHWVERETAGATANTSTTVTSPLIYVDGEHLQTGTTASKESVTGGGNVLTQQLSSGDEFVQGVAINNRYGQTVDIAAALRRSPALTVKKNQKSPQVLIVHTHTTECYLERDDGTYADTDATRTVDETKNMVAVGKAAAAVLEQAGIGVVHDTVIHDQPYTGAYNHSKASVQALLKKYPSVRVVLDLHRDAIYPDDHTRIKPTVMIEGKAAAQVMILVGMMNTAKTPNPHVQENLSFGARLQQQLHTEYAGLVRPLNLVNARYNQQLIGGSLLIEIGSDANTLEEAVYAAELVANGLVQVLTKS